MPEKSTEIETEFQAGDVVFLIRYRGHKKLFEKRMVYSVSNVRKEVRLHGSDMVFDHVGQLKVDKSWEPSVWIELVTPELLQEIKDQGDSDDTF